MNRLESSIPKVRSSSTNFVPPKNEMHKYYLKDSIWTKKPDMTRHNEIRDCFLNATKNYRGSDRFAHVVKQCVRTPSDMFHLRLAMK